MNPSTLVNMKQQVSSRLAELGAPPGTQGQEAPPMAQSVEEILAANGVADPAAVAGELEAAGLLAPSASIEGGDPLALGEEPMPMAEESALDEEPTGDEGILNPFSNEAREGAASEAIDHFKKKGEDEDEE